ncbi:MAG: protein kinase family protein, partial [Elainellaceae cyanobacterium]
TGITHTVSIGTQGYMPGEQLSGTPHFSSDVYAVGMMGIQALTGQHPRLLTPDPRTGEIDWHHYCPEAAPELVAILDCMVRYDYRARYSTARDAFDALDTLPEWLRQGILPALNFQHLNNPVADFSSAPAPSGASTPNTYSETPLPDTQSDRASESFGGATLPVGGKPDPDVVGSLAASQGKGRETAATEAVAPRQPAHAKPSVSTSVATAVATQVIPALTSPAVKRAAFPTVAIAILIGLGLITWRAFAPELRNQPDVAVQSTEPANSESASASASDAEAEADADLPDEISTPRPLPELLQEAQEFQQAEDYNQALALYEEAIANNESSSQAHSGRCFVLNKLEQYQDAIAACDQAIAIDSGNVQAIWSKGFALEQRGQPEEALTLYNQAIGYDPEFAEAWNNKGTALLSLQNTQGALAAFDRAIALNPEFAEAWNNRGATLWSRRQFQEALSSVEKALQLRPDYPEASSLRKEMRQRLGI